MYKNVFFTLAFLAVSTMAQLQRTTPVPILRQINTHNDDGSYTYGYENGDGSYKIENKAANGEVSGKYGYFDDKGTLREIEYGASRNGFNPSGTGIQVPAPVISTNNNPNGNAEDYDDGSYRPGPGERSYRGPVVAAPVTRTRTNGRNIPQVPQYQQEQIQQNYYQPQPQQYQQPQYQPVQIPSHIFKGHPASNINLNSGSYTIQY